MKQQLALFVVIFFWGVKALSAPGEISQKPLGTVNSIPPNLMLIFDSSGSMGTALDGSTRLQVAKNEAKTLINNIDGFYVGLMRFNDENGGKLVKGLTLLDSDISGNDVTRTQFHSAIDQIGADDWTPLAETVNAVGHYFTYDIPTTSAEENTPSIIVTPSTSLTMIADVDPDNYVETPKSEPTLQPVSDWFPSNLFSRSGITMPSYNTNGSSDLLRNQDMAIKGWCQKNSLVILTDGEPTRDFNVSTDIRRYEKTNNHRLEDRYKPVWKQLATNHPQGYWYEINGHYEYGVWEWVFDYTERLELYLADVVGALWDIDLRPDLCDPLLLTELNDDYNVAMTDCSDLTVTFAEDEDGTSKTIYQLIEERFAQTSDDNLVVNDAFLHRYKNNIRTYLIGFAEESLISENTLMGGAARLGAGKFHGAGGGDALGDVFDQILKDMESAESSASGVGLSVTGSGDFLYRATYNALDWTGVLEKISFTREEGTVNDSAAIWSTGNANTFKSQNNRVIFTWNPVGVNNTGIPFRWSSLVNGHPLKDDLETSPDSTSEQRQTDDLGGHRLKYLRGKRNREQSGSLSGPFRNRSSILGDIIHSSPKFVGAIEAGQAYTPGVQPHSNLLSRWNASISNWSNADGYISPVRSKSVVYVNANDGMLHAFDDADGKELFAYMPSYIASTEYRSGLHFLTDPAYEHRFYNDATPYVSEDVWLADSTSEGGAWRTLLVTGAAGGGKGVSLLDVTDVGNLTEDNAEDVVLWEFTHDDLGYTYSEPYIGPLRNGMWGVIIGNGYNSTTGKASVFILNVQPNLSDGWTINEDYFILETTSGAITAADFYIASYGNNGMSTVVAGDIYQDPEYCSVYTDPDKNNDKQGLHHRLAKSCQDSNPKYFAPGYGSIDRLYAGDMYGNLWAFNLMSTRPAEWKVDFDGEPLFKAPLRGGVPQPITTAPKIVTMGELIQRCDANESALIYRDNRTDLRPVGARFGQSNVIPFTTYYDDWWNFNGFTVIPDDGDNAADIAQNRALQLEKRGLTCGPNALIIFGTGQFLTQADVTDTSQRALYAVWDNYKAAANQYPLDVDDLDERIFSTSAGDDQTLTRTITDVDDIADGEFETTQWHITDEFGWYVNFDQSGERMISDPSYDFSTQEIFFTTIIPEDELCGSGGFSLANRLDAFNGVLSKDGKSNAYLTGQVGTELDGLRTGVQMLGRGSSEDYDIYGGSKITKVKSATAKPPVGGLMNWYEIKQ